MNLWMVGSGGSKSGPAVYEVPDASISTSGFGPPDGGAGPKGDPMSQMSLGIFWCNLAQQDAGRAKVQARAGITSTPKT
jgi:hypothetical protein